MMHDGCDDKIEMKPLCRHCRKRERAKPRGLCFACYKRPAVRCSYSLAKPVASHTIACRHCKRYKSIYCKDRSLCRTCWDRHKDLYELSEHLQKFARVGIEEGTGDLPQTPTDAEPGSELKLRILAKRAAAGLCLHHPADVQRGPASRLVEIKVCRVQESYS